MSSNLYAKFEIVKPLNGTQKKIAATSLKVGDRFIYPGHDGLLFKTNIESVNGKFLCCDECGITTWIDGNESVVRINGVVVDFISYSRQFKNEYLKKKL